MAAINKIRLLTAIFLIMRRRRKRRYQAACRQVWCRPWILRRPIFGTYHTLLRELEEEDLYSYKNYVRLLPRNFALICEMIDPYVRKEDTNWRKAISVGERLAVTLRYLATGRCFLKCHNYNY